MKSVLKITENVSFTISNVSFTSSKTGGNPQNITSKVNNCDFSVTLHGIFFHRDVHLQDPGGAFVDKKRHT